MDIIEKMIKKGIYSQNEDLEKTKQDRIDFVNEIYKKEQEKYKFTYSCINKDENFTGQCNNENHIEINIKRIDDMVKEHSEFVAAYNLLITIFHELQHAKQYLDKELTLQNYRMAKEQVILQYETLRINFFKLYNEPDYYSLNHNYFSSITLMYAGRIILSVHINSSMRCALQPTILATANIAVYSSRGIPSISYTNPL